MSPSHGTNIQSPMHNAHGTPIAMSPMHRPPTLADLIRGSTTSPSVQRMCSPNNSDILNSPGHILSRPPRARHKCGGDTLVTSGEGVGDTAFDGTNSLPLRHRARRLPLGHVKSLGDVTENKHDESLEVIFCDGKEISSLDKIQSEIRDQKTTTKHLKSVSDPKSVYSIGKVEPESEIYFADVSSCVSLRPEGEEVMYYSDPTSSGSHQYSMQQQLYHDPSLNYMGNMASSISSSHMYEQVSEGLDEDETGSHHTSDDTMIVHTSSSDHSIAGDTEALDTENTYSVISPGTDLSTTSPMVTDTDAYSCYTPITPNSIMSPPENARKNFTTAPAHPAVTSANNNTNLNEFISFTKDKSSLSVVALTKSNLNLHHPLHPVHHSHHQAYHHQLSHNHVTHSADSNFNGNIIKKATCANINAKSFNKKMLSKKSRKSKKYDVSDEPRYESVEAPSGCSSANELILNTGDHKTVKSDIAPKLPLPNVSSKLDKLGRQNIKHIVDQGTNHSSVISQSPPKHKHYHRQHTHHKHPHHFPHHRHPTANPQHSSSSSSSSLSSPCSPSTLLPQDCPSDLNGNVTSSPSSVSPLVSPVTNTGDALSFNKDFNVHSTLVSSSNGSSSIKAIDATVSSNNTVSSAAASLIVDTKAKLCCNPPPVPTTPTKKQRSNLSLPLRKLIISAETDKTLAPPISCHKEGNMSSPIKSSTRNAKAGENSSKEFQRKKNSDKEYSKSSKSESRRRSKDIKSDIKSDTRSPTISDLEIKKARKIHKSKNESSARKSSVESCRDKQDPTAIHKESSTHKNDKVKETEVGSPVKATDERENTQPSPANVHHLLQNLKSVNV